MPRTTTTPPQPQPAPAVIRTAGFYRIQELALPHGLCGLARSTIYALGTKGRIPRPQRSARLRCSAPAVNCWLAERAHCRRVLFEMRCAKTKNPPGLPAG